MKKLLALITLLTTVVASTTYSATTAVEPSGWSCRNTDLEVSCSGTKCEVAEHHTPMDVYVSASAMSICAYSGCWEGAPSATMTSGSFMTFTGIALPFSTNSDNVANVSVTVNSASKVAMILVEGMFASPALCTTK